MNCLKGINQAFPKWLLSISKHPYPDPRRSGKGFPPGGKVRSKMVSSNILIFFYYYLLLSINQ